MAWVDIASSGDRRLVQLARNVPFDCLAGIILNYLLDKGLNNPTFLFPGLDCACAAILLGCFAHLENEATNTGRQTTNIPLYTSPFYLCFHEHVHERKSNKATLHLCLPVTYT